MSGQGSDGGGLESLLAVSATLADRGFSERVMRKAARRRRIRLTVFAASALLWLCVAALSLSFDTLVALEQQLAGIAAQISVGLIPGESVMERLGALPTLLASITSISDLVPLALFALTAYALLSVQLRS